MLTAISTAYGKLISNYTTNSSTIQYFEPPRSIFLEAHFIRIYYQLYTPNFQKNISLNSYVEQAIEMQVAKDAVAL